MTSCTPNSYEPSALERAWLEAVDGGIGELEWHGFCEQRAAELRATLSRPYNGAEAKRERAQCVGRTIAHVVGRVNAPTEEIQREEL